MNYIDHIKGYLSRAALLLLMAGGALMAGCEDFLVRDVPNQTTDEEWWQNKGQLNTALNNLYKPMPSGTITYKGKELTINQPQDAIKNGIAMLTEDRRATGILGVLSIADNVSIASLNKYLIGGIMLDDNKIEKLVQDNVAKLSIKTPSSKTQIQSLSGGNQQKVLIARWLANDPDVFIMDEPTRGIDVGAKYEIYCIIAEMAKQGKSIIMISSEMSELIGMSDRIMVMCDGRCTGFIDGDKANQENIMTLATQFE